MKKYVLVISVISLVSCAHHKDVRPGTEGVHRVAVVAENKEQGAQECIEQANHFCKEQNKYAAFINEDAKYTGSMDEGTYNKAKTASKVAEAAGGAAWVFGNKNASNAGGIVGLGGGIADNALGKGYTVEMKFKCQ